MPSLTQLAIAGSALALVCAPTATKACSTGKLDPTKEGWAIISVVALVTAPLWIVPAVGAGIVIGTKRTGQFIKNRLIFDDDKLSSQRIGEEYRRRTDEIRPYFEEAEKNPTPLALFRLGMHLIAAEDFVTGRRFLRRSIDLAKQAKPDSWDSATENLRLLPLLALAHQQFAALSMRLHRFPEAYEYFVETKRLVDNLNSLSAEQKQKASQKQPSLDDKEDDEELNDSESSTLNILDDASLTHDIAWASLHIALYTIGDKPEDQSEADNLIASVITSLKEIRHVSIEFELHYCIALFWQRARRFEDGRPSAADDGDDDPEAINWNHPYYTESIPVFIKNFEADILPLFVNIVNKIQQDKESLDKAGKGHLWDDANLYLGRCFYVIGNGNRGKQTLEILVPSGATLRTVYFRVGFNLDSALDWCDPKPDVPLSKANYFRVNYALGMHRLSGLDQIKCGAKPHNWVERKFHRPTWCEKCHEFITWSENRAGCFECSACRFRCHRKCKEQLGGDAPCNYVGMGEQNDHQHVMRKRTLHRPHYCGFCDRVIKNFFGAYSCESCGLLVHEDCKAVMRNVLNGVEKK